VFGQEKACFQIIKVLQSSGALTIVLDMPKREVVDVTYTDTLKTLFMLQQQRELD